MQVTGGRFAEDAEDADYVVLGRWEEQFFDETWYKAQDYNKPVVTPAFVFDSYKNGRLMDPKDYLTRGPVKPRKGDLRRAGLRPATGGQRKMGKGKEGAGFESPGPTPARGAPKWLQHCSEPERLELLQGVGAILRKNLELTYDALAIHLHEKVRSFSNTCISARRSLPLQMPNRTINSWRKYCTYHKHAIEGLRQEPINNTGRATPTD